MLKPYPALGLFVVLLARLAFAGESGTLSGRVIDVTTGRGIPDASIRIYSHDARLESGTDGAFIFTGVSARRAVSFWWSAPGYSRPEGHRVSAVVSPGGEVKDIELPLTPVVPLEIRVLADRKPVPGARVMLRTDVPGQHTQVDNGQWGQGYGYFTDRDGQVFFDRLDPRYLTKLTAVVQSPNHLTKVRELEWRGTTRGKFIIALHGAVRRSLHIRAEGNPVKDGYVVLFENPNPWPVDHGGRVLPSPYRADLRLVDISAEGIARFPATEWPKLAAVVAPRVGIRIVDLASTKGSKNRDVDLAPGPRWSGIVRDTAGQPLPGVRIAIRNTVSVNFATGEPLEDSSFGPLFGVDTDAAGRFSLPRIAEIPTWSRCRLIVERRDWHVIPDGDHAFTADDHQVITMAPRASPERVRVRFEATGGPTPMTLRLRTIRYRTGGSQHRKLEKVRQAFLDGKVPRATLLRRHARLLAGFEARTGPTYYVPRDGWWPLSTARQLLRGDGFPRTDALQGGDGTFAVLWGLVDDARLEAAVGSEGETITIPLMTSD